MRHKAGLLAIPAGAVAVGALLAAPALAATTFTVSPGGAWSGTQAADSSVGIRDAVSNQVTLCSGLAVTGSFKSGQGLSGTGIGALTNIAFTGCQAEGVAVTVTVHTSTANPAPINLTQEFPVGSTVFTGQATNISLTLDDARGCHAVVGAKISPAAAPASPASTTAAPTIGSRSPRPERACSSSPRRLSATTGNPAWTCSSSTGSTSAASAIRSPTPRRSSPRRRRSAHPEHARPVGPPSPMRGRAGAADRPISRATPAEATIDRPNGALLESVAMMIVGKRCGDATCLHVADAFERLSGGFPAPPAAA